MITRYTETHEYHRAGEVSSSNLWRKMAAFKHGSSLKKHGRPVPCASTNVNMKSWEGYWSIILYKQDTLISITHFEVYPNEMSK